MVRTTLPRPARLALRLLAVSGVALATANCATNPQQQKLSSGNGIDPKYGVKASPRLYNEGDVIPKGGGRRYTGKPYVVAGQTYVPKEDPRGYVREGLASWYGSAFHGRMTANGEVFDRHSIAAAHPTLPLPSYARVTNLDNGASMIVRVNDRGPYHAGRVMDVSEEAAEALGFHRRGTARVRVEYAGKAAVAGSDDRKLLASLRTDGQPAGRSTVMMADLGPSEEPERYARSAAEPLAFKPPPERAQSDEAPASRPERPAPVRAPIVLASAAMRVPAAVQPTAQKVRDFRPAPIQVAEHAGAGAKGASLKGEDLKVAGLNPAQGHGAAAKTAVAAGRPARPGTPAPTKLAAAAPAALPASAKSTLAHLASGAAQGSTMLASKTAAPASAKAAVPTKVAAAAKAPAPVKAGTPTRTASGGGHARLAGIY